MLQRSVRTEYQSHAIILCAGDGRRWGDHLGIPKQLLSFNDESLLERMSRFLKANGVYNIACVTNDPRIQQFGVASLAPMRSACLAETLLSTQSTWNGRTIIILGDIYFTPSALRRICSEKAWLKVFGRPWGSRLVNCNHGELFALSFNEDAHSIVIAAATEVVRLYGLGARGNLWDIYHTIANVPYNSGDAESEFFSIVDDFTNDFDTPKDYEIRRSLYQHASSNSLISKIIILFHLALFYPAHFRQRRPVPVPKSRPQ